MRRRDVATRTRPSPSPLSAPTVLTRRRFGPSGVSGMRAASRSLNCSPIWRRSSSAESWPRAVSGAALVGLLKCLKLNLENARRLPAGAARAPAILASYDSSFRRASSACPERNWHALSAALSRSCILSSMNMRGDFFRDLHDGPRLRPGNADGERRISAIATTYADLDVSRNCCTTSSIVCRSRCGPIKIELADYSFEPCPAQDLLADTLEPLLNADDDRSPHVVGRDLGGTTMIRVSDLYRTGRIEVTTRVTTVETMAGTMTSHFRFQSVANQPSRGVASVISGSSRELNGRVFCPTGASCSSRRA